MLKCEAVFPEWKTCKSCLGFKRLESFNKDSKRRDGLQATCRDCTKAAHVALKKSDPARIKTYWRTSLLARYGLTHSSFAAMLAMQEGLCGVCKDPLPPYGPSVHIDHDHTTGRVRGVLHGPCNMALGLLQDRPAVFRGAADYLEKHQ